MLKVSTTFIQDWLTHLFQVSNIFSPKLLDQKFSIWLQNKFLVEQSLLLFLAFYM